MHQGPWEWDLLREDHPENIPGTCKAETAWGHTAKQIMTTSPSHLRTLLRHAAIGSGGSKATFAKLNSTASFVRLLGHSTLAIKPYLKEAAKACKKRTTHHAFPEAAIMPS